VTADFADTPEPPYTAVIFTSVRADGDDAAYDVTAARMEELAAQQPGYLGIESTRDPITRLGITVSYWRSPVDARHWKAVAEHLAAQERGRTHWYAGYRVRIATVEREYASRPQDLPG
jgi:heme-degrading monooxygenase HmoA